MAITNVRRSSLFIKQQTTLPVPPEGFVETTEPVIVTAQFETVENDRLSGKLNSRVELIDTCRSRAEFLASCAMRQTGSTTLTAPTEYAELLKVSGFEASATPPTDTYELINATNNIPKGSALAYMDGNKFSFTNTLVGNSEIVLQVGAIGLVNTTLSGYIDSPIPVAEANPAVTLNANPALVVSCADLISITGEVIPAQNITFRTNPTIANTYTIGGTQGIKEDTITDYSLTCEITFPVENSKFSDTMQH